MTLHLLNFAIQNNFLFVFSFMIVKIGNYSEFRRNYMILNKPPSLSKAPGVIELLR